MFICIWLSTCLIYREVLGLVISPLISSYSASKLPMSDIRNISKSLLMSLGKDGPLKNKRNANELLIGWSGIIAMVYT